MRVKVGDTWHEASAGQPVMIELSEADKQNIAAMQPEATRYAEFDDGDRLTVEKRIEWMDRGARQQIRG